MNAEALFHSIGLKASSRSRARFPLASLGAKISALAELRPSRRTATAPCPKVDRSVGFEAVVCSAITAPPRRLMFHHLAILDFALTGAVVFGGGFLAWKLVELFFGFLVW